MSEQINAQISAFIDGELDDAQSTELLTLISQNKVHEDTLHRYVAIREALHPEPLLSANVDLLSRISDAIQHEEDIDSNFLPEGKATIA